jgi:hypothetical protein
MRIDENRTLSYTVENCKITGFVQSWRSGDGENWRMAAEYDRNGKIEVVGMNPDLINDRDYINWAINNREELEDSFRREKEEFIKKYDEACDLVREGKITETEFTRIKWTLGIIGIQRCIDLNRIARSRRERIEKQCNQEADELEKKGLPLWNSFANHLGCELRNKGKSDIALYNQFLRMGAEEYEVYEETYAQLAWGKWIYYCKKPGIYSHTQINAIGNTLNGSV